ncbi:transposase [Peribacillus butanolivorans]|uniref:transposase n=1 Tax=Peribacillus butanolivorans TaxID=421767 RepID=UPI003662FEEB
MPRKPRIWYPGAMYHITSRGNRHSNIFLDDKDRLRYLHHLEETKEKYFFELHSYCLMTNHVHLLLETMQHPSAILCIS